MRVTIVSTGGTIAVTPDSDSGASPSLTGDELVATVPDIAQVAEVETREFSNVPSPWFSIADMYALVEDLQELDDDPAVDGIVVTQGMDILEETAYFTALTYGGAIPVGFTGAMRPPG